MNRLIKGILYITIGCIGMGVAAVVMGLVLGGGKVDLSSDSTYNPARKAVSIIRDLASDIKGQARRSVTEIFNGSGKMDISQDSERSAADVSRESTEYYEDGVDYDDAGYDHHLLTADAYDVKNLRIDLRHGEVDIEESQDNKIRVFLDGSPNNIRAECADGELTVEDDRQGSESRKDVYICLQIPYNIEFDSLDMQVDAGVVDAECGIQALVLNLQADAADISVSGVDADVLNVSVGTGVVDIDEGSFGAVDLDCGVGQLDLDASISRDSKISCGMGAVDIEMDEDPNNFNYVISCGMGSIDIGDNTYSGIAKARKIDNGASATITLDCGMGNISID